MAEEKQPTEEGKRRYNFTEPVGFYNDYNPDGSVDERFACTCAPACANPCKGSCGCEACDRNWQDYLSTPMATV
jgi:hypothetical protein